MDKASQPSALTNIDDRDLHSAIEQLGLAAMALDDEGLIAIEKHLLARRGELPTSAPFGSFHNGTETLGRLCYAACRVLRPDVVVETGVAYGVTSAYVLQALAENGSGTLQSIDLPPLGTAAEKYVGYFVPKELRKQWKLRIGSARKLLPEVLQQTGGADIFIHDSLHTYAHMRMEFAAALARPSPRRCSDRRRRGRESRLRRSDTGLARGILVRDSREGQGRHLRRNAGRGSMIILVAHNYYQQPGGEDQTYAAETKLLESKGHRVIRYEDHNARIANRNPAFAAVDAVWSRRSSQSLAELVRLHSRTSFIFTIPFL